MNAQLLLSIGIIFGAFAFWVLIQESARRFARRHPEFGPAREEGGECGISCSCANWKTCKERNCEPDLSKESNQSIQSENPL